RSVPSAVNRAAEQSARSLMFGLNAARRRTSPISSATPVRRPIRTASSAGSSPASSAGPGPETGGSLPPGTATPPPAGERPPGTAEPGAAGTTGALGSDEPASPAGFPVGFWGPGPTFRTKNPPGAPNPAPPAPA